MRSVYFASLVIGAAFVPCAPAALTTFSYTQTAAATGSGTIAAFSYDNGGGPINFTATPLPGATVVNPAPGSTPAGFVAAINAQSGNSNEPNVAAGLTWSGFVTANGTRGANQYTIQIPLKFVPKQIQAPADTNDYSWSVLYGDNVGGGVDTVGASLRFAFYLSRDTVIDALETSDTFQRYTQLTQSFVAGADSFTNTDITTTALKDATDPPGAPTGVDAAGRDLALYFAWRDGGSLSGGPILVDTFTVGGLLDADPNTLTQVPEPSFALLALGGLGLFLRRRR